MPMIKFAAVGAGAAIAASKIGPIVSNKLVAPELDGAGSVRNTIVVWGVPIAIGAAAGMALAKVMRL